MDKLIVTLLLSFSGFIASAQDTGVESSTYGIQTGFLGVWFYNEARLGEEFALRTELGLDASVFDNAWLDHTGFILAPAINVEPRWYYNLQRRAEKGRNTIHNSGNFVSVRMRFHPDLFTISNYEEVSVIPSLGIIPTWGIRRHIGRHFNYEAGIGLGYEHVFAKSQGFYEDYGDVAANLHLRLGYSF